MTPDATARQMRVSNDLAHAFDRFIRNYRTFDQKGLTEGEVIVGLGFLLGQHVKDATKVASWLQQISIAALDATKGSAK